MIHSTQFTRIASGGRGTRPLGAPRGRDDRPPKSFGLSSIRVGDVHSQPVVPLGRVDPSVKRTATRSSMRALPGPEVVAM